MKRELSLEEIQKESICILQKIDTFCVKHNKKIRHAVTSVLWNLSMILLFLLKILNVFGGKYELRHGAAQSVSWKYFDERVFLPFKDMLYEGVMLPVPQETEKYLSFCYGPDYMELPEKITYHHNIQDNK